MVLNRLFVLSLILVTAVTVAEFCEEDQFETGWLGGCADCPEDPEKHCDNEGENADNCRSRCITESKHANIKIKHRMANIITYLSNSNNSVYIVNDL